MLFFWGFFRRPIFGVSGGGIVPKNPDVLYQAHNSHWSLLLGREEAIDSSEAREAGCGAERGPGAGLNSDYCKDLDSPSIEAIAWIHWHCRPGAGSQASRPRGQVTSQVTRAVGSEAIHSSVLAQIKNRDDPGANRGSCWPGRAR